MSCAIRMLQNVEGTYQRLRGKYRELVGNGELTRLFDFVENKKQTINVRLWEPSANLYLCAPPFLLLDRNKQKQAVFLFQC